MTIKKLFKNNVNIFIYRRFQLPYTYILSRLSVIYEVLKSQYSPGLLSHSTSTGRDWNELHKTPTGQINLFLFLRLPSQTLIQMHAVALQFNNYPDSHHAVSLLVLFPLN